MTGLRRLLGAVAVLGALSGPLVPVGASAPVGGEEPATPVLSARRVPVLVQSLAAGPVLAGELDAVVDAGPPQRCLWVEVAGRVLYRAGSDTSLIPASNQKVLTAWLATQVLGEDHVFRTEVAGALDDQGTVAGDLVLVGGGDPVLRTAAYHAYFGPDAGTATSLEELADAVVAAGVERVTGSVVGDESRYDTRRRVPTWPDDRYLEQHQLGPLSALSLNQGFVSFPVEYSDEGLAELVPTPDPPGFAASVFTDLLRERGVQVDGAPGAATRPRGLATIAAVDSPPLAEIVAQLLNRSDNQISELLVKEVGVVAGAGGTTAAGLEVFADAFADAGLPPAGVRIHDGSGLGYDNRASCAVLAAVLGDAGPSSALGRGLPVAGRTGTLRERFEDPPVQGAIRAKTGSLNEVTSLAGFASPEAAPTVLFAYLANGAPITPEVLEQQERLGRALVGYGAATPLDELGPR